MHPKIIVIGSTNTDMVVETPHLPNAGETVLGGAFRMTPGGKGANQAVAAARAGGKVSFITSLGDDQFGKDHRIRLAKEGIDLSHISLKTGKPSGVALIMVDKKGENIIAVAPGANSLLTPDDLVSALPAFCDARMLVMQLEIPLESVQWVAEYAARLKCPLLLNPAPMPEVGLPDELLRCVNILTPNEGELMALAADAHSLEEAAKAVMARGPQVLVVTQGKDGATVFTVEGSYQVSAFPVTATDTVGAGDCFSATLGVALAEGCALPDAVRFAAAAAALSTTRSGAQNAMPTRERIDAFLEEQPTGS